MDQVRSLLPTSVVHTTHEDTASLTALPQGKRALNPVQGLTHVDPPRRSARIRCIHDKQETQRSTYYPADVTIDIDVIEDTTPPQSTYKATPTAQHTPQHTVLLPLYDKFYVDTYNIGGVDVTPDRFHQFMTGFNPVPHVLNLQEFRPSATSHVTDFQRLCRRWGYHLVSSTGRGVGGVAIMIHTSLCPSLPVMKEYVHGHLISVDPPAHPDPLIGLVTFACYYGPHHKRTRAACIPHLHQILRRGPLLSGDYNATTGTSDASTLTSNIWPRLVGVEEMGAMTDLLRIFHPEPPYTRCRRYRGTQSYRIYASKTFLLLFTPFSAKVCDSSGVPGAQDHDPVVVKLLDWLKKEVPPQRCGMWERRDLRRYRQLMDEATPSLPGAHTYSDVEPCYATLKEKMLDSMNKVNAEKGEPPRKTHYPPQEWTELIRTLSRQCRHRSKTFYKRVKSFLLSPATQSTLPVPGQGIQRILERNNPWNQVALNAVPSRDRLQLPDTPTDEELRTFARATRRKSPGPDGIPPSLLAQLPDTTFRKIVDMISICNAQRDMPPPSCIPKRSACAKGKRQWQDPDRWRSIAMSNSINRLIMRWVHAKIYPMLVTWLHAHQYGQLRGVSPAHATLSLMDMIDATCDVECLFSFDLYHAFDSPSN